MEHAIGFLLTGSSVPRTEPLNSQNAAKLRAAHAVEYYQECGWCCATGFDAEKRITVMVHAASFEAIHREVNPDYGVNSPYKRLFRGGR